MKTVRMPGRAPTVVLLVLLVLLGAAPTSLADVLRVPEDHAELQDAIDAASAGDVIAITGGTHDGVKIDKPLTLVGSASNPPLIRRGLPTQGQLLEPCLELATEGRVVLAGLVVHALGGGLFLNSPEPITGTAGELLILHCDVRADVNASEFVPATPAITVASDHVLIVDSQVRGGELSYGGLTTAFFQSANAGAGLQVSTLSPSGLCTVLDSEIRGGDGPLVTLDSTQAFPSWQCGDPGGASGAAVGTAGSLVHGNSTFTPGEAGHVSAYHELPFSGPADEECDLPVPPAIDPAGVGSVVELDASTLALSSGGFVAGQTSVLTLAALEDALLLVGSPDPTAPQIGLAGALYLQTEGLTSTPLSLSSPVSRNLTPGVISPEQWGTVIGLQLYSPATGLTRPVFMAVLPP